jgi:hypothetical protein
MTLGNMRANGVRSLDVCCWLCHHRAVLSADPLPDHMPVPVFGPRSPVPTALLPAAITRVALRKGVMTITY